MNGKVILISFLATTLGWAGQRSVTICLNRNAGVDYKTQSLAQGYATKIYESAGIHLHWKPTCDWGEWNAPGTDSAPNLTTIAIGWARKMPPTISSRAWASALPFQATGERVTLYLDRLAPVLDQRDPAAAILGHILAHEIGHVLMGHNAHASHGLMKEVWNSLELAQMPYRPMGFTAEDAAQMERRLHGPSTLLAQIASKG